MNELTTIDNLDVTQLPKKKLLDYFALTISQEQPKVNAYNIIKAIADNSKYPKYKEISQIYNTLPDKSPEELLAIRDKFIKRDNKKIKKIKKEIQQYQANKRILAAEYKEQRKNLTVDSFANYLNYDNAKVLEKKFIGEAQTKTPEGMGCLSTIIAIAVGVILYNFPPFELVDVSAGYGERAVFSIGICMVLSLFILPILYKLSKKISWNYRVSKCSNINIFLEKIPLEINSFNIKNGKPSKITSFNGYNYDYANSLNYSMTIDVQKYEKNIKKIDKLEKHISIWRNKGEEFLFSMQKYASEYNKLSMLHTSNTRLGEAMPEQWTQNTSKGMIETSLIFSSLIASGRADTWKEAANLAIEDKFKQAVLKELGDTRQSMIDTMIKTGERIRESISEEIYQMANNVSSSIEAEGIRNQLAMNNVNSSLDRIEVINSAILIDNLIR